MFQPDSPVIEGSSEGEQFRLLAESIPQMAWMAQPDGSIFWYNQRWYDYTGTSLPEMRAGGWDRVHHPETLSLVSERWRRSIATGEPLELEFPLRGRDGGYRWFLTRVIPIRHADGRLQMWLGTSTDVTELRGMREELQAFRDRLDLCAEGAELGIWFCDLPFDRLNWSLRVKQHFGLPPDAEVTIDTFWQRMHPEDREPTAKAINEAIADRARYDVEYRTIGLDGKERWIRAIGAGFRDEADVPRRFDGVTLDVTARKQADAERTLLEHRERVSAQRAELLNRIGPLLIGQLDLQKLTQQVTDLATQLSGAEFGAFFRNVVDNKGESYMLYTLSGVPREHFSKFPMPRATEVFAPTFRGEGVVRSDDIRTDPRYGKNDPYYGMPQGHLPVCSYLAVPVISRSGEVLGGLFFGHSRPGRFTEEHEQLIVGVAAQAAIALDNAQLFQEVNEERLRGKDTMAALQRSNAELRRANADLERFAYSASHDLKEPLRMVSLFCQLLQEKYMGRLDAQADSYITQAVQGAHRMEILVRDLLHYMQVTAPAEEVLTAVDANVVLGQTLHSLRDSIQQQQAVISQSPLPPAQLPAVHLQQIFQNLITNAIKYRSSDAPRIHVSGTVEEGQTTFAVRDNGIGIEPRYHGRIFELFQRLHGKDEYEGTGIGLAVCQKIVARYGGRIWVESEPGRGATFFFTIPGAG